MSTPPDNPPTEESLLPNDSRLTLGFKIDEPTVERIKQLTKEEILAKFRKAQSSNADVQEVIVQGVITKGKEECPVAFASHWAVISDGHIFHLVFKV